MPSKRDTPEYRAKEAARKRAARAAKRAQKPTAPALPPAVLAARARLAETIDAAQVETLQSALTAIMVEVALGIDGAERRLTAFTQAIREARGLIEHGEMATRVAELESVVSNRKRGHT